MRVDAGERADKSRQMQGQEHKRNRPSLGINPGLCQQARWRHGQLKNVVTCGHSHMRKTAMMAARRGSGMVR